MKYYGRLLGIAEEQLVQDVEDNNKGEEGGDRGGDNKGERRLYDKIAQRAGNCKFLNTPPSTPFFFLARPARVNFARKRSTKS